MFAKSLLVSALAALVAAQSSVISFTNPIPKDARVGSALELKFTTTNPSLPVSILLRKGDPNDLKTVSTLTSSATGGSFSWTPDSKLESGDDYALQIQQGTEINYLGPFSLQGGSDKAPSSPPSSHDASSTTGHSSSVHSSSVHSTTSATPTASRTFGAVPPYGTGNATIPRNTTIGTASITRSGSASSPTGGAGTDGPKNRNGTVPSTGGASTLMVGGSAIALLLGAVAACVMA